MSKENSSDSLSAYLDMNIWIALARGISGREKRWEGVVDGLRAAVETGRLILPLSAAHYLELWHRRDRRSREEVGVLMRDLSDYATLASPYNVQRWEVESSILRFVDPAVNKDVGGFVFGHGVNHAFGSTNGRFRFLESIAAKDGESHEGPAVDPPPAWELSPKYGRKWEWFNLVGTSELLESKGVDRTPEHRVGSERVTYEQRLREQIKMDPSIRDRLDDIVITDELMSLLDLINDSCKAIGIDPHSLFLSGDVDEVAPKAMRNFVAGLPSSDTWTTLRTWKHRDLTHPWEQHDWTDLVALSIAVPYCDTVITERRWAHLVKASGLANRYGTTLGHGLRAIENLLSITDGSTPTTS